MARFTRNKYPEVIQLDVDPTDGVLNLPFAASIGVAIVAVLVLFGWRILQ
jgi:hypothetical protein